ncbi:heme-binding protein [Methylonatrum kenyense]|uniref:GlcG/HbpS family heme-binding protein n=1 Tax=Methylonatrum kenyense TaxID=455253 RepID=UPI0020BE83B5|nr:heme-binding protein [Methylonatrum kenyense]MCK8514864.1 heme-binding protein [Methylonatrum kenyense]
MPADVFHAAVTLPLATARQIIAATLAEGEARELQPLTVAVLDAGGHLVALERADGAGLMRPEVALGKARAALGIGIDSGTIGARNEGRDAFLAAVAVASGGTFVPVPGGVLVLDDQSRMIGAVGVSGDASDQDAACACAGIETAGLRAGLDAAG